MTKNKRQRDEIGGNPNMLPEIDYQGIESDVYHNGLRLRCTPSGTHYQPIELTPKKIASLLTREEIEEILYQKYQLNRHSGVDSLNDI